jgi:hypothetical protein
MNKRSSMSLMSWRRQSAKRAINLWTSQAGLVLTFGFCSVKVTDMNETATLSTFSTTQAIPQTLAVTRIKSYTRKLAEIERFIEHYVEAPRVGEPEVNVHTYWNLSSHV